MHLVADVDARRRAVDEVHIDRRQRNRSQQSARFQKFLRLGQQGGWVFFVAPHLRSPDFAVQAHRVIVLDVLNAAVDRGDRYRVLLVAFVVHAGCAEGQKHRKDIRRVELVLQLQQIDAEADFPSIRAARFFQPVQIGHAARRPRRQIAAVCAKQAVFNRVRRALIAVVLGLHRQGLIDRRNIADREALFRVHLSIVAAHQLPEKCLYIAVIAVRFFQAVEQKRAVALTIDALLIVKVPRIIHHAPPEDDVAVFFHGYDGFQLFDAVIEQISRRHDEGQRTRAVHIQFQLGRENVRSRAVRIIRPEQRTVHVYLVHHNRLPVPKRSRLYGSTSAVMVSVAAFLSASKSPTVTRPS